MTVELRKQKKTVLLIRLRAKVYGQKREYDENMMSLWTTMAAEGNIACKNEAFVDLKTFNPQFECCKCL